MTSAGPHLPGKPLRLPYVLAFAGARFAAPADQWQTLSDFVDWAETDVTFPLSCSPVTDPDTGRRRSHLRHWLSINPHTGAVELAPRTDTEAAKVQARHMVWALTHDPGHRPACERVEGTLRRWVGPVCPGAPRGRSTPADPTALEPDTCGWSRSTTTTDQMLDVRTVTRAVAYLDAGLDLHHSAAWLAIGAQPDLVERSRRLLAAVGKARAEDDLMGFVTYKVGGGRRLHVGQNAVTDGGRLQQAISEWVGWKFAIAHREMRDIEARLDEEAPTSP